MKYYRVIIEPEAGRDLENIYDFINQNDFDALYTWDGRRKMFLMPLNMPELSFAMAEYSLPIAKHICIQKK